MDEVRQRVRDRLEPPTPQEEELLAAEAKADGKPPRRRTAPADPEGVSP